MNRTAQKIPFPSNTSWVTHDMHAFQPRPANAFLLQQMCESLIRGDDQIRQVLRSCKTSWYFAVTLGQKTLALKIYDPTEVNDFNYRPVSSAVNRERTAFFEIDRLQNIRVLTPDQIGRVMRTAPLVYSDRCLKREEIRLCDEIQEAMMGPIAKASPPVLVIEDSGWDNGRPDFTLESVA